jgi:hypothetical protein
MGRTQFIITGMTVLVLIQFVLDYLSSLRNPPRSVKIVERCEMTFATVVFAAFFAFAWIERTKSGLLLGLGVSLIWYALAVAIYLGKRWARMLCIILSTIRIVTIIGIPFSVISLYITLSSEEFKGYMTQPKPSKSADETNARLE